MPGGNDIDSLKFSVILDSQKFETEMKRVEGLAEKFEKAVRESLTITNLLEAAQSKGTKDTKAKAQAQKEVVLLTRAELEAKKAAGTITDKELKQLKALVAADKQLLDEQNKVLAAEKKQLDIQEKQERLARRQAAAEKSKGEAAKFTTQELLLQSGTLRGLGSYITQYVSVFGAMSIVRNMVRITGEFEAQHTALRAILQDTAAADNIFNQLQVLAVKSPFTFQNLTAYAKQLTAFSVPVNEVYETTKKLADVSAGLGVDMGRIILAYGQVRSAEFLRGQEVRQFTEAGIPILKELADQFKEIEGHAISVGEVFTRISARQVPFEMVEEAFNRMTSAGGKFYQMQEVLAETVKGKISNLQDAWEIMLSRIGDQNSGTIKGIITWVTDLLANYEKWMGVMSALIKMLGTYAAGLALVNTAMKVQNFLSNAKIALDVLQTNNTKVLNALFMSKHALNQLEIADDEKKIAVQTTLNIVRKAGIAVITSLIAVIWTLIQRSKQAKEEANKNIDIINSAMAELSATMADFNIGASRVKDAFNKMKSAEGDATKETKDFEQAVDDLKKQFPKFIDDNLKLAETIDDLGTYWARAREEMNKYYADEARESIKTDLQSNRDSDVQNISKKFTKYVTGLYGKSGQAAGRMMATTAWRYVTGDIDRDEAYALAQELSNAFGEKTGNKINYSRNIMKEFDKFVDEYNAVMQRYSDSLDNAEQMLAAHNLSTTRNNYNDFLLSRYNGLSWNFGGTTVPYEEMNDAQKEGVVKWLENNGLLFDVEDTVDSWAERQREKLQDGKITDAVKGVIRATFDQFKLIENPGELTGWQKDIQEVKDSFGDTIRKALEESEVKPEDIESFVAQHQNEFSSKFKADATTVFSDFLADRVKDMNAVMKSLKETPESYANFDNAGFTSDWLLNLFLKSLSEKFYGEGVVDFGGTTKDAKAQAKEEERKRKERQQKHREWVRNQISDLKQDFQDLKELKAAYDKFKELGFDDTAIGGLLQNYFGTGIPDGGFGAAFEALAVKMENLGDKNAAQDIRNFAAGKDWKEYASNIEAAQKAQKKFNDALEDFRASTKRLNLEGFAADLDKIIVDADSKNRKLQTDWSQKLEELGLSKDGWIADYKVKNPEASDEAANAAWVAFYEEQKKAIDDLLKTQTEYNNKVAQRQIDKKADAWVKQMLEEANIDLTDWGDKTIEQIEEIQTRLQELIDKVPELIPDELKDDANAVNITFTTLLDLIKKILQQKKDDTDIEHDKKRVDLTKKYAKEIGNAASKMSKLASSIKSAGEAMNSKTLTDFADGLSFVSETASSASDAFSKMFEYYEKASKTNNGAGNWFSSLFGSGAEAGFYGGMIAFTVMMNKKVLELAAAEEEWYERRAKASRAARNAGRMQGGYIGSIFGDSDLSTIQSRIAQLDKIRASMAKYQAKVSEQTFTTKTYSFWQKALGWMYGENWKNGRLLPDETASLETLVTSLGMELYDKYGNLNAESLQHILDTYEDLKDEERSWIEQAIQDSKDYEEAMKAIEDVMSDLFGQMADDMVDTFLDNFHTMGDAVDNLGDTFTNLGETILRAFLRSYILDEILSKYQEEAKTMMMRYATGGMSDDEYAAWLERFTKNVEADSKNQSAAINGLISAFDRRGLINWGDEETSDGSLGNGIKGITEDTANLLASYLNAIRADVSYGRLQWERIAVAVEGQRTQYITLNDYMAQVAADTANIAETNRQILQRMDGFINDFTMASDYGDSLKVQIVN